MADATKHIDNVPRDIKLAFESIALKAIERGMKRWSSDGILHVIRWQRVERGEGSFKCNDHWTAYLARWFIGRYPEHRKFFILRKLGSDNENYEFFNDDE